MPENKKFRLKIFPKILLGYLIVLLIALIAFFSLVNNTKNSQTNNLEENLIANSTLAVNQVNDWIDKNIRLSRYIASLEEVSSMDPLRQKPMLEAAKKSSEWMTLIFTINEDGQAVARSDDKKLLNYSDREYFKQAMTSGVIGDQVLIGKAYPEPLHCFGIPIKDSTFRFSGVIAQCSQLLEVSKNITSIKIGNTGHAFLVDSKNRLIAHGSNEVDLETKLADFSQNPALLTNKKDEVFTFEDDNGIKKIAYTRDAELGWTLVLQQDYSEAFAHVEKETRNAYIFLAGLLLISIILAIILSKGISNPIKALSTSAVEISKGNLSHEIPGIERSDEIGELASSMNRTKRSLSISLNRLKQSQ